MTENNRLKKVLDGLRKMLSQNSDIKNIEIETNFISIKNGKKDIIATLFYVFGLLITPTVLLTMEIIKSQSFYTVILLLLVIFLFGKDFLKILKSETTLTINFLEKNILVEKSNGIFGKYLPKHLITFDSINKSELIEKSISHKYGSTRWRELTIFDKINKKIILTSFKTDYPESYVGQKIKLLIDTIIWTEKQKK
jgi:hypothetical protein